MNSFKRFMMKIQLFLLGLGLAVLAGCSSSGGDSTLASTISGTASAGAPIIGTVTIKDSSTPFKTKTVTIAADGKYTIDVTGLTAPFMMNANGTVGGTSYNLYSAATSADVNGNINVTPLTDLIVANIAGQISSAYFTAGNFSNLTTAQLNAQEAALQARLQTVLTAAGVAGSIDLLRATFAADHTGLDAALDVLRVAVDPLTATATITNIIDNVHIIDDLASQTDVTALPAAPNVTVALSDLQQIVAGFDAFGALFATSLPASDNATLLAMFDSTFLMDGLDKATFVSQLIDPTMIGVKFTNISLVPGSMTPAAAPTTAKVTFDVIQGGGNPENMTFAFNKAGGIWKMSGNQQIAQAEARSFTRLQDVYINNALQTNYIDTGLSFHIKTPTAAGIASIVPAVTVPNGAGYYAVVTGPGLPGAGALYVDPGTGNSLYTALGAPSTYTGTTTQPINAYGHNHYPLDNTAIAALADNEIYTIEIYHDGATPNAGAMSDDVLLAAYTSNAGKRPYLLTELTVASFAVITAPSKSALTAFANAGGTITASWTLPAATLGAKSNYLHYWRNGSTSGDTTDVNLRATATSAPVTMPALAGAGIGTLQANGINLAIRDSFNRELMTIYNGN